MNIWSPFNKSVTSNIEMPNLLMKRPLDCTAYDSQTIDTISIKLAAAMTKRVLDVKTVTVTDLDR
jgi:hypothetical protein